MTGTNTPNDGGNVVDFASRTGRTGFTLTPDTPVIPPAPATPPSPGDSLTGTGRRSPLDVIADLPDPALLQPPITAPAAAPGMVPATFQSEPAPDMTGPRIGALSLAACLAVAVAALRGTHTVLSSWWEQRQARQAETAPLRQARLKHQLAMQQIADKGAQQQAKTNRKVPSSSEFGRKSLSGRSSGGSGRSGGGKSASGSRSSGLGSSSGGSKKSRTPAKTGGSSTGSGTGGRSLFGNSKGRKNTADVKKNRPHTPSTKTPKPGKGSAGTSGGSKDRHSGGSAGGKDLRKKTRHADGQGGGRSSLTSATGKALKKAAGRRLKKRRTNPDTPALWAADTKSGKSGAKTPKKTKRSSLKKTPNTPKTSSTPKTGKGGQGAGKASRLHAALRNAAKKTATLPKTGKHHGPKQATKRARHTARTTLAAALRHAAHKAANRRLKQRRTRPDTPPIWGTPRPQQKTAHGGTDTPTGTPGPNTSDSTWTGFTRRNTPFQNAAQATTDTTITVEPENPRHQPRQPMALPAAASSTKEPHTMPPLPARPDPRITKARHQAARTAATTLAAGRQMDAQHETEITLDDALDEYGQFKDDGFKTHDQCLKLAGRARTLRDTLADFAEDLAVNHNLIGALFSGAMARLAESMDLVARMADEMQTSSLEAAEMSEAADNDLNDAYRPYSTATADAGLATPSAPIHNQT